MIINHNIMAMNTNRQLGAANAGQAKSMEKLSSGLRINRAGDDAAGLAISEKMRGQIRGLDQAQRNAQDGISMIQTAEGALSETHSILQRMRELATQAANDTNVKTDRTEIQKELNNLTSEINRIGNTTEFNTQKLLSGTSLNGAGGTTNASGFVASFQIGANQGQSMTIEIEDMRAKALGLTGSSSGGTYATGASSTALNAGTSGATGATYGGGLKVTNGTNNTGAEYALSLATHSGATAAVKAIDNAIETVSAQRSNLGAFQNRLEHTINNLSASSENLTAAESRVRDVDMAKEMMEQTKKSILAQASQAMLAQANQKPQSVLQLLG